MKETFIKKYGRDRRGPRENFEKTMLLKYGVKNALQNKEILKRAKDTIFERYGVSSPVKNESIKEKIVKTNIKKYGNIAPACSKEIIDKIKQTNIKKYGTEWYFNTDDYKELRKKNQNEWAEKAIDSAVRNGTRYSSKPEEKMFELLCSIFGKNNVIRQYKTKEYPFLCDFYLVKQNIYIEYNGTYFHSDSLYDEVRDKEKYLKLLEKCNDGKPTYKRMLDVWSVKDKKKYEVAKKNNLNFIIMYKYWDNDWLEFTKGRISYSEEKIVRHLKNIINEQVVNKCVRVIGERL